MKNPYFFNGRSCLGLGVVWWCRGPARSALMQRGARFFQQQCFPCSVALVLGRGGAARSAPMQRGARFFQKQCFPCSVALVLGSDDTQKIKQTIKLESNMFYNLLEYVENMQGTINETHKQSNKQKGQRTIKKHTQTFNQTKDQSSKQSIKHTINQIKQSKKENKQTRKRNLILKIIQLPIDRPRRLLC